MSTETQVKQRLLETDGEFQQLAARHDELESRLTRLSEHPYLSEPEQLEKSALKTQKLQLKDRMENILQRSRNLAGSTQDPASPSVASR